MVDEFICGCSISNVFCYVKNNHTKCSIIRKVYKRLIKNIFENQNEVLLNGL